VFLFLIIIAEVSVELSSPDRSNSFGSGYIIIYMLQYSLLVAVPSAANELLLNIQTNTGSVADSSLQHAFRNPPSSPTPPIQTCYGG